MLLDDIVCDLTLRVLEQNAGVAEELALQRRHGRHGRWQRRVLHERVVAIVERLNAQNLAKGREGTAQGHLRHLFPLWDAHP